MVIPQIIEQVVLGAIQGIAEWLPVSSEGMIILAKTLIFKSQASFEVMIGEALFLHLGSVLAAVVYFRNDITRLFFSLKHFSDKTHPDRPLLLFLIITTLISGMLGLFLIKTAALIIAENPASTKVLTLIIGLCLMITGIVQLIKKEPGSRLTKNLNAADGIILGIAQGLSVLPGISRSGLTISSLLFRNYNATAAMRLSFLMSIPIVFMGNIVMNLGGGSFQTEHLIGLAVSFVFSLLTIDFLLKIARKINFGSFVLFIALLVILSVFLPG